MGQAVFSVRMDAQLKEDFDRLCADFGMNMSVAINIFARAVVREQAIPFAITSESSPHRASAEGLAAFYQLRHQAQENGVAPMSLDEINDLIAEVRQERR